MEIQEAIKHAREVADKKYKEGFLCCANSVECAKEHEQLAEWLEELQQYRAIGTVEEIKKVVQFLSIDSDDGIIEDLKQLNKYQLIGTADEFREAMEKQRAKKYKKIHPCKSVTYYQCPCCDGLLHINENFCGECGQAIDWDN